MGLLVIFILGLPLCSLYKWTACPLGRDIENRIHREHRASRDVRAFAKESCILVANKIRVRDNAPYALCLSES